MENEERLKKEKLNKQIAFVILVICCATCVILGITGGVYKFIKFVDDMNPQDNFQQTRVQDDFFVNGELHFKIGGNEIGKYKCQASSCGWAPGAKDDLIYEIKSPFVDDKKLTYSIKGVINNRFAIIYDDENSYEPSNIFIYDIINSKKIADISAVKNYNMDTSFMYFVKSRQGKWGIISLAGDELKQLVDYQFDYIGTVLPEGETFAAQKLYAVILSDKWGVISTTKANGLISKEFDEAIIYYNHKIVVTRDKSVENAALYNIYTLNGQQLEQSATYVELLANNILISTTEKRLKVYDTGNAKVLFEKEYNAISELKHEVEGEKLVIYMAGNKEFETENKALGIDIEDEKYLQEVLPTNDTNNNPQ